MATSDWGAGGSGRGAAGNPLRRVGPSQQRQGGEPMERSRSVVVSLLVSTLCIAVHAYGQTGLTDTFAANGNGVPVSARTRLLNPGGNVDLRNTAEHELLHGIGFAIAYQSFADRVRPEVAMRRNFTDNGAANGTLRMI